MIKEITIRDAQKADCPRILELVRELAAYENAPQEVEISVGDFEEAGFGKSPVWFGFVAEHQGIVVGISICYIRFSTWKGKRLFLEDLLVTESYRRKGIGKLLFDRTLQAAKEKGFTGMNWQVLDWNEPAINFYKKYNANFDGEWINVGLKI